MPGEQKYRPRLERRTRHLQLRGCDYHVHEWGTARQPCLVMLHGWGDSGASFQFTVDELARDWHIVAPDWRGFGDSSHNAAGYWFPDYIADLDAMLAALGMQEPATLIGHSMGGNVAALFAGVFPDRVAALVNVEGFGLSDSDPAEAPARYRKWIQASRHGRQHHGYADIGELVARIRERSPRLAESRARFVAEHWATRDADGRWRLKADSAHRWPNPVLYRRAEARACWQQISAPVLLVTGADTEFADAATRWHAAGANADYAAASVLQIAAAGHMVHFEQPQALAAAIEAFLAD